MISVHARHIPTTKRKDIQLEALPPLGSWLKVDFNGFIIMGEVFNITIDSTTNPHTYEVNMK